MAVTGITVNINSGERHDVLLESSSAINVQNTSNRTLRFCVQGETGNGGLILANDSATFDYSIVVWCDAENASTTMFVLRD